MTRVLIVARTRMHHDHVCVGGHDLDHGFRSVRLLDLFGDHFTSDAQFQVGDIWEVEYRPKEYARAPHLEDVFCKRYRRAGRQGSLRAYLCQRVHPWRGSPSVLFDGTLRSTEHGAGYVPVDGRKPKCSTGYWIPEDGLSALLSPTGPRFAYPGDLGITRVKWVGTSRSPRAIPAGTLVRVSLTRAFGRPPVPEGHYLQISGVYLDEDDTLGHE